MELQDTIALMNSDNYKDRFKAEYYQLRIRRNKLGETLESYYGGTIGFELGSSINILREQLATMNHLLEILVKRAVLEGIEL